jgi:hypothetical protein
MPMQWIARSRNPTSVGSAPQSGSGRETAHSVFVASLGAWLLVVESWAHVAPRLAASVFIVELVVIVLMVGVWIAAPPVQRAAAITSWLAIVVFLVANGPPSDILAFRGRDKLPSGYYSETPIIACLGLGLVAIAVVAIATAFPRLRGTTAEPRQNRSCVVLLAVPIVLWPAIADFVAQGLVPVIELPVGFVIVSLLIAFPLFAAAEVIAGSIRKRDSISTRAFLVGFGLCVGLVETIPIMLFVLVISLGGNQNFSPRVFAVALVSLAAVVSFGVLRGIEYPAAPKGTE